MKKHHAFLLLNVLIFYIGCQSTSTPSTITIIHKNVPLEDSLFTANPHYLADGFDFPVGKPDAKQYYNAQPFTKNNHLGDDWNGVGGGNTDLGDDVFSIANGYIRTAEDYGRGWGNVVKIWHCIDSTTYVESIYAHLDTMLINAGDWVKKGDLIGTIGNANGAYWAHLHLEIRTNIYMSLGGGYSTDTTGYINPTTFILNHR